MQLLIDIGNTSVNWALQENDEFIVNDVFQYDKNHFSKNLNDNLIFSEKPSEVLISNVAGEEILNLINDWVKKRWGLECWQPTVLPEYKALKNSYSDTGQMGIDRWLAMVASWEKYDSALCLVGCGTAMTIDLINHEGKHLGGYIIPGIELMQKALADNTEKINIEIKKSPAIDYADNTQDAVNNGAFIAAVSMIDRVAKEFSDESDTEVKCIISGGMAKTIKPLLNHTYEYEPDLVLKGLASVYKVHQ